MIAAAPGCWAAYTSSDGDPAHISAACDRSCRAARCDLAAVIASLLARLGRCLALLLQRLGQLARASCAAWPTAPVPCAARLRRRPGRVPRPRVLLQSAGLAARGP
jgi:hypothetical protein